MHIVRLYGDLTHQLDQVIINVSYYCKRRFTASEATFDEM